MFSCKKCRSDLKDTDRYCYGCGAYIGEPAVRGDDWQEPECNEEDQIQYEYNEEGKIITLHCEECDAIVEKYHKYCSNCGKLLENNTRIELMEPKTSDESSVDSEWQETGFIGECDRKIRNLTKKFFSNKKLVAAVSLILVAVIAANYLNKQFNKPVPRYEQDTSYNSFAQDKDFVYYSYFVNTQVQGLQEKRGIYKIKADGSNMSKISDKPALYINLYKDYIYYINNDESRIYKMKKDGSDNKKISDDKAVSLIVDRGYIYYRDISAEQNTSYLYRMKLDGTKKKEVCKDALTYNILGNYIYYSSRSSLGDVYRIKTDGSDKSKICEISGVLKYIKDDYIYYSKIYETIKEPIRFMNSNGVINKVKLDGTSSMQLSNEVVLSFLLDDNNIYYDRTDDFKSLYKVNLEGNDKTKIAENASQLFYVANDQVYYIDYDGYFPYKKNLIGGNDISLLGADEKLVEAYKVEQIKRGGIPAEEIEDINKDKENMRVVTVSQKADGKVIEAYNAKNLDGFLNGVQGQIEFYIDITKFIKDGSNNNLDQLIQLQYDGKKIAYISYKKDSKDYKVDKVLFFESIRKVEKDNTVRYFLSEKKGASEENGFEILSIKH